MSVLTRMPLPTRLASVRRRLSNRQVVHAIVQTATNANGRRTLWRVDGEAPEYTLYVVSPDGVDAEHLAGEFGVATDSVESRSYAPVLARLQAGQEWRFRLRANPTKAVAREGRTSARVALRGEDKQVEWLLRRAPGWGFSIPTNRLGVPEVITRNAEESAFRREQATVTLAGVTFDGVLKVEDPAVLSAALVNGMGHGRAYGLGLMTLAPLEA